MDLSASNKGVSSPGSYVAFLLANSAQELSQLIENYLAIGQFEAARYAILQLLDLNKEEATKFVYKLLHLQLPTYVLLCTFVA
jgi:hypothetical protein